MVRIYRFSGVRPDRCAGSAIAAVPYDVVNLDEARALIAENPYTFLRVSRPDADLPQLPPGDERIYRRARENYGALLSAGLMKSDPEPSLYLYRVSRNGEIFLGLCCCLDVDDYRNNRIRRHEQTRYDKEEDRTRHIEAVGAHNGPVVLLYQDEKGIGSFLGSLICGQIYPDSEVLSDSGFLHQIFRITDQAVLDRIEALFGGVTALYIADGHHRAKAALNVVDRRIAAGRPAGGEVSRFMGVLFAHDQVRIHGYSRLITDIGTYTFESFIHRLEESLDVRKYGPVDRSVFNIPPRILHTDRFHIFHMYLAGDWYECTRPAEPSASLNAALDVTILQEEVLRPILGITDPRGDARLQYLGGARPVADLEALVDHGRFQLAFAMQPVRIGTVLAIADEGGVMPPKSTWFEPKLLSGLVVHQFE